MSRFIYFATYHVMDFGPIPPSQVTSPTLKSMRCCSSPVLPDDNSVFILHSTSVPGMKRNTRTAKTVVCLPHVERRMQLRLKQTHCAPRISKEEGKGHLKELRFNPIDEGVTMCQRSSRNEEAGQHGRRYASEQPARKVKLCE